MATIKQDDLFTYKMTCIEEIVTLRTKKIITDTSTDITGLGLWCLMPQI